MGSKNGTVLNGHRMSESKEISSTMAVSIIVLNILETGL